MMTGLKTIVACETQPVTLEGVRSLLADAQDLAVVAASTSLTAVPALVLEYQPSVVLLDKGFGVQAVMDCLSVLRERSHQTALIVWGVSMSEAEALRLVQAGVHGVLRKTASTGSLVECLSQVAAGKTWMEPSLFHDSGHPRNLPSKLTVREREVVNLVEQGLKNKDIAEAMGIRPGTVKIHLKHIFEKTGVRGRFGLALSGLRAKRLLSYTMEQGQITEIL